MASHAGFIAAAFVLTGVVIAVMLGLLILDHRALRRELARFPDRGGEGDR